MATGGVVTLTEDDLSCDVCCEVYRDPQALRCLHTFCKPCVDNLVNKWKEIECPQCREVSSAAEVRKDFKTQSLVDKHNKERIAHQGQEELVCGMCQKKEQIPQLYCAECDKFICITCHVIHKGIKDFSDHDVQYIQEIQKTFQDKLQTTLTVMRKEATEVQTGLRSIETNITKIYDAQKKQIQDVDEAFDKQIQEINDKRFDLHKHIKDVDKSELEYLLKAKDAYKTGSEDIESNVSIIAEVIAENHIETLKYLSKSITDSAFTEISQMKEALPEIVPNQSVESEERGSEKATRNTQELVRVMPLALPPNRVIVKKSIIQEQNQDNPNTVEAATNSISECVTNYYNIKGNTYVKSKTIFCKKNVEKIRMINNCLYVACGLSGMAIYDKDFELIKNISDKKLGSVTSMDKCPNGDIIVSAGAPFDPMGYQGLHILNQDGDYKQKIVMGNFSDVCIHADSMYALDNTDNKIVLLKSVENVWNQVKEYELQQKIDWQTKLCVTREAMYISSRANYYLEKYDHEGNCINHKKCSFNVCDIDNRGYILAADWINGNLYVMKGMQESDPINLEGEWVRISSAVADICGDTIWIGTAPILNKAKLVKYSKKQS